MRIASFIWVFLLACCSGILTGQITDDFEDAILPMWVGDVDDFVIDDGRLRLSAPSDKGRSVLFTEVGEVMPEMEWSLDFEMTFSPSNQNRLKIWMVSSDPEAELQEGYHLSLGESGSDDAIEIILQESEEETLLARGTDGAASTNPEVKISIVKDEEDNATLTARYDDGTEESLLFNLSSEGTTYFVIECHYTSTRADRFYFDNFYAGPIRVDSIAPEVVDINASAEKLELTFNESLDPLSVIVDHFSISPSVQIEFIELIAPNVVAIIPSGGFEGGTDYTLNLMGISDRSGNMVEVSLQFSVLSAPSGGDLILNEILFNPRGSGSDYVEVKNISDQEISLQNVYLINTNNGQERQIESPASILPNEIIVWTEDVDNIIAEYPTSAPDQMYEQDIPSYNNDEGNVTISQMKGGEWVVLDEYDYDERDHLLLVDEEDGVSLERIDPQAETNDPSNWTSAASDVGFGTPGLENSTASSMTEQEDASFQSTNTVFSPDGDGSDDEAEILYQIESGFIGNAAIYDLAGRKILDVWRNRTLSTTGSITWNGQNENGQVVGEGIYILVVEIFDLDGDTVKYKEELVVARR